MCHGEIAIKKQVKSATLRSKIALNGKYNKKIDKTPKTNGGNLSETAVIPNKSSESLVTIQNG